VNEPHSERISPLPAPLEAIRARLAAAWDRALPGGTLPRIEDQLVGVADGDRLALLKELVVLEAAYRRQHGEQPRAEEYRDRFPELAPDWLEREVGPLAPTDTAAAAAQRLYAALSALEDKTVKVWDAQSGKEVLTLKGHTDQVSSVAFSVDGKRIASGSYDQTVKVCDAQTRQEAFTLKGHTRYVMSVAFSPDGKRIATGSTNYKRQDDKPGGVKVWDADTGQEVLTLTGHTRDVWSVAFSPDGKRIVSGSWDLFNRGKPGEVKVWDAYSGQEQLSLKGHTADVRGVCFSPDGKHIVSGSTDFRGNKPGEVKVWDAHSGQDLLTFKGHTGVVWSVAFSLTAIASCPGAGAGSRR
jgi:WD40 repeat protein